LLGVLELNMRDTPERTHVIAVHGVGNHEAGAVAFALLVGLQSAGLLASEGPSTVRVSEFNWHSFAIHPSPAGKYDGKAFADLNTWFDSAIRLRLAASCSNPKREYDLLSDYLMDAFEIVSFCGWPLLPFLLTSRIASGRTFEAALVAGTLTTFLLTCLVAVLLSRRKVLTLVRGLTLILLRPPLTALCAVLFGFGYYLRDRVTEDFPVRVLVPWYVLLAILMSVIAMEHVLDPKYRLVCVIFLAAELFVWFGTLVLPSVVKILLDIFHYIGDARYREGLQAQLTRRISDIPADTHLVLATHSLGSVIAWHLLSANPLTFQGRRITLLTAGSPILRLFTRFFPGFFFPVDHKAAVSSLLSTATEFRWVNCYRPWDPIGGSLSLHRVGCGEDVCTAQWSRLYSAHADYWNDPVAVGKVLGRLRCEALPTKVPLSHWSVPRLELAARPLRPFALMILRGIFFVFFLVVLLALFYLFATAVISGLFESVRLPGFF
jgi:hypothetical protein